MAFSNNNFNQHQGYGWYRPVHPDEHVYTPGYGFSPRPPFLVEQKLIGRCSAATVVCLIGFLFLSSFLTQLCYQVIAYVFPIAAFPVLFETVEQFSMLFGALGALTIPFAAYAVHTRIPAQSALPFRKVPPALIFAAVMVALAVSVVGIHAAEALSYLFSAVGIYFYEPILTFPAGIAGGTLYVFNLVIVPAIFEEIAFRGVILQSLRRFGDSFALLVSSILFALAHTSPLSMPNAFVMGLVIGYFVLFTGSLHTGMIIHLVHNLLVLLISQLGGLDHSVGYIVFLSLQLVYLVVGAAAAAILMRRYENMFSLKNSNTINRIHLKLRCFFCTLPFLAFVVIIVILAGAFLA